MSDMSGGEQVPATQVSESTPDVASIQPEVSGQEQGGTAPWHKDLEALGLGDQATAVDKYLREQWQPRVTQLEQQYAPYKNAFQSPEDGTAAAQLLYQLRSDPHATYELLGEMIRDQFGDPEQQQPAPEVQEPEIPDPRLEFVDNLMQEREQQAAESEYAKIVEGYKADLPDLNEQWFAKLVIANGGDTDAALVDYKGMFPSTPPEPAPPTSGTAPTSPTESAQWDGDLEGLVRNVIRRGNAKN